MDGLNDILESLCLGFGGIGQPFHLFKKVCTETIKTIVHFQNDKDHISKKWTVFYLAWYDMSNTRRKKTEVPNVASDNQPSQNLTLHLNKKHVLFQVERSGEVLKTDFSVTTKEASTAELKKTFLERTQRRFGKFLFCLGNKSCFYKYSISQDISNAGCKEPKYQT